MTTSNIRSLTFAIAQVIKRQRLQLALSQEELGARAGLDRTYVSGIERSRRNITVETLSKLIRALSMTHFDFFKLLLKELE